MISRRSTKLIGEYYNKVFIYGTSKRNTSSFGHSGPITYIQYSIRKNELYDYLFVRDYEGWFCHNMKNITAGERTIKDFIMRIHSGQAIYRATETWTTEQRTDYCAALLEHLARDGLLHFADLSTGASSYNSALSEIAGELRASLFLDGYYLRDKSLIASQVDSVDIEEEADILMQLYIDLGLNDYDIASHHLKMSEENYIFGRYDDCLVQSRKFLECVAREVARRVSKACGVQIGEADINRAVKVREYLETVGFVSSDEIQILRYVYGVLSNLGGHPSITSAEPARIWRQMALIIGHHLMLTLSRSVYA